MLDGKIFVAGHTGMVGAAILRVLAGTEVSHRKIITETHATLDLRNQAATRAFFMKHMPKYVFLAAAKVGGIQANIEHPAAFTYDNLMIQTNVIDAAWVAGVQKLLFIGSSCMYPRECPQPMTVSHLFAGPLEPTNASYVMAKFGGMAMCQSYRQEYGMDCIMLIPPNMYGPGDHYGPGGHVIADLIHRCHRARGTDGPIPVWGTGEQRREFMYVDDFAKAAVFAMSQYSSDAPLNIGVGEDIDILSLAKLIAEVTGVDPRRIVCDPTKPIGVPRKLLDSSEFRGWWPRPLTPLPAGLRLAYGDYLGRGQSV